MKSCPFCGFEPMPAGKACPLCDRDPETVEDTPTVELPRGEEASPAFAADAPPIAVGTLFAGRYRVNGVLGKGGMGTVYRVHDVEEPRDLALKVLHPDVARDADGLERFQREAEILARIRHPAIPRVFGFAPAPEPHLLVEFVDGGTLKDEIVRRGPFPTAEIAALGATLAGALGAAHEHGIVHRDVKPQNVMRGKDGATKLLDFGIARKVAFDAKTITKTGMVMGTPEYMSPEQLTSHRVDARSDIYSLGVVLFELATGQPPFEADTPFGVALKHKTEPPPAPREIKRDVPVWLERVILKCLEKDKAARYETAAELAAELTRPRGKTTRRRLPSGDAVVEDAAELSDWALVLWSPEQKKDWLSGMALLFEGRYYRLAEILPPVEKEGWTYHLAFWPQAEVFRKVVDYAEERAETKARHDALFSSKLKRFFQKS